MSKEIHYFTWKDVLRVIRGTDSKTQDPQDQFYLMECVDALGGKIVSWESVTGRYPRVSEEVLEGMESPNPEFIIMASEEYKKLVELIEEKALGVDSALSVVIYDQQNVLKEIRSARETAAEEFLIVIQKLEEIRIKIDAIIKQLDENVRMLNVIDKRLTTIEINI